MTLRLYRDDPYLLRFEAAVTARRQHQGQPAVVLDRTAFYAESGGQPWDTGSLSGVPVVAVIEHEGEVLHVLGAPLGTDLVLGIVDAPRREDHRQQHHGQHLLSRAFVEVAEARTVSFHLGTEVSSIDLDREVTAEVMTAAETRANEVIWSGRPVSVRMVSREEATALGVTVPAEVEGAVRLVEAEGFDLQPCGGTHPRNTAEVGVVVVAGSERYKGGSRVRFLCGHRAVAAFRSGRTVLDQLASLFSAPVRGLTEAATKTKGEVADQSKRLRAFQAQAVETEARRLFAGASGTPPAVVIAAYEGWPPADLRTLAQALVALGPCVAFLGSRAEKAYVTLSQSEGMSHDLSGLLQEALRQLGGKGGGRGNLVQGAFDPTIPLAPILEGLAARIRPPKP
jgi:alanyl-tRNA synthetase